MNKYIFLLSGTLFLTACTDNGFLFRSSGDYAESSGNYENFNGLDNDFKNPVRVERLNTIESDVQAQTMRAAETATDVTANQIFQASDRVVEDLDTATTIKPINQPEITATTQTVQEQIPVSTQTSAQIESYTTEGYVVQIGSFANAENAYNLQKKLSSLGTVSVKESQINGTTYHRVRLGKFSTRMDAENLLDKLRTMGYVDAKVVYEP